MTTPPNPAMSPGNGATDPAPALVEPTDRADASAGLPVLEDGVNADAVADAVTGEHRPQRVDLLRQPPVGQHRCAVVDGGRVRVAGHGLVENVDERTHGVLRTGPENGRSRRPQ